LFLCVAHRDEEFVVSRIWALVGGASKISSSLLVQFDSLSYANLDLLLGTAPHIPYTVTVATASALLSISNQFSNSSFDMPSGS
jgi:hypothetical protein